MVPVFRTMKVASIVSRTSAPNSPVLLVRVEPSCKVLWPVPNAPVAQTGSSTVQVGTLPLRTSAPFIVVLDDYTFAVFARGQLGVGRNDRPT